MERLADDVHRIALAPRDGINAYVLGDVLVDAGIPPSGGRIVKALRGAGRTVTAHTLTHAHPDHAGGSKHVVSALGVPMWAPAGDAADVEAGRSTPKPGPLAPVLGAANRFPAVPVSRRLREGDEIGAGFVVLDTPGHSPGEISFWRESDRVLVGGDVFFNLDLLTLRVKLGPPVALFTVDVEQNRRSMRRLADLEPSLALFGHGPPLRDAAPKLRALAGGG